jgi:hypothetical protein
MDINLYPYKASWSHAPGKWYVQGPGQEYFNYYQTFDTEEITKIAASIANDSYKEGYFIAQRNMKEALGIKS